MRINFVMEGVHPTKATGGPLGIFEIANGLIERGHDVKMVSAGFAGDPDYFDLKAPIVQADDPPLPVGLGRFARRFAAYKAGRGSLDDAVGALDNVTNQLAMRASIPQRRGAWFDRLRRSMPEADVSIATSAPVAAPTAVYGTGLPAYFMQHYEAIMADDFEDPVFMLAEAKLAVDLPILKIASSSWLGGVVEERHGGPVPVCTMGIDQAAWYPDGSPPDEPFTVVSYGGRNVRWKDFPTGAEAIRLARREIPDLRWRVYGGGSLPPDNDVAPYEDLGWRKPEELRAIYSESHATLCPSWYESFPRYPIEAMACGSAVVTTPFGTEDYTRDGENCLVVPRREPERMAEALVRLWRDQDLRRRLTEQAREDVKEITWERSVTRMEELLEEQVERARRAPKAEPSLI